MALSYLRLHGFMKQVGICTKALSYLSSQTSRSCSTSRNLQAEMSDLRDQNLETDVNCDPVIPVSDTDLQTGNRKSISKKKLHQRVLTVSEIEEARRWKDGSLDLEESDSFGNLWRGRQRDLPSVKHDESSQKKLSKLKRKNHAKKMVDKNQQSKKKDVFGTLSDNRPLMRLLEDVDDKSFLDNASDARGDRSHIRLSKIGRYKEPYWYAKQINKLGKEGKILEAIEMLEEQMLKKDRVMPTTYVFNQLFGILGKVGYTKKAFQLFNKMKKMSIKPDGHTYTCLFNCCSNSPWPQDGLKRTNNLHELIKDKGVYLHPITYKAMVKAYGVCGDIQAAFQTADEMCKMHPPDVQLYSFLLMACVTDTKAGLRHALQVWKLMHKMRIKPDLPVYNLFLRVVRDTGFGTDEDIKKFPKSRNLSSEEIAKGHANQSLYPDVEETDKEFFTETEMNSSESSVSTKVRESSDVSDVIDAAASLFGSTPVSTSIDLSYPENRLAALGGPLTILEDMKKNGVSPNVLTVTIIVCSLPQNIEAESWLLEYMAAERVERDIDFYNMIIRRRNRRNDYEAANEVLKYIADDGLFPNLRTFGCLAMGCTTLLRAKDLLRNINEAGLEPNIEIFGLLAYKSYLDFEYKEALLNMLKKRNIYPNHVFLRHVEYSIQSARKKILKTERNENVGAYFKTEKFKNSFEKFMINYPKWLKSIGFDQPEHPWKDFRQTKEEGEEES